MKTFANVMAMVASWVALVWAGSAAMAQPATLPYATGFEEGDDVSWEVRGTRSLWCIGSAAASSGERSIYISADNGATRSQAETYFSFSFAQRALRTDGGGEHLVRFDWQCPANVDEYAFYAALVPDTVIYVLNRMIDLDNTPEPIELIRSERFRRVTNWEQVEAVVDLDANRTYYLLLAWQYGMTSDLTPAVDNISVTRLSCPSPGNLRADSVSTTELFVSWTPRGTEAEWLVQIDEGAPFVVSDPELVLDSLSPATHYSIAVRALCGDDTSRAATLVVQTLCGSVVQLPFTDDFESYPLDQPDDFLPCWGKNRAYCNFIPYPPFRSFGQCLLLTYRPNYASYVILPRIEAPLESLEISFMAIPESGSDDLPLLVAVVDSDAFAPGVPVDTLAMVAIPASEDPYEVSLCLDEYTGSGGRIMLCTMSDLYLSPLIIDNLWVGPISNCRRPEGMEVIDIMPDEATVVWEDRSGTGAFRLCYWPDDGSDTVCIELDDTMYTLTSLAPRTRYFVSVQSLCSSEDSRPVTRLFQTPCESVVTILPWIEDFEHGGAPCWLSVTNARRGWRLYTDPFDYTAYMVADAGYNDSVDHWLISPQVVLPADNCMRLSWRSSMMTYGDSLYYQVLINPDGDTLRTTFDTLCSPLSSYEWGFEEVDITRYAGHTVRFAFRLTRLGSNATIFYIDDVSVRLTNTPIATLAGPGRARVGDEVTLSAILTQGLRQGLAYTFRSAMASRGEAQLSASDSTVTLTYLAAGCDTVEVEVSNPYGTFVASRQVVVTDCRSSLSLPFIEGFGNGLGCWTTIDADGDGQGWMASVEPAPLFSDFPELEEVYGSSYVLSLSYDPYMEEPLSPDNWLVSPRLTLPEADEIVLEWNHAVGDEEEIDHYTLYLSTGGNNASDFLAAAPLADITPSPSAALQWAHCSMPLAAYAGQQVYIAFRHHQSTDRVLIALDSVRITSSADPAGLDPEADMPEFTLRPNPATGHADLNLAAFGGEVTLILTDAAGRRVRTLVADGGSPSPVRLDLHGLASGTYFVQAVSATASAIKKLIVR